jgi:hypothetical protein
LSCITKSMKLLPWVGMSFESIILCWTCIRPKNLLLPMSHLKPNNILWRSKKIVVGFLFLKI